MKMSWNKGTHGNQILVYKLLFDVSFYVWVDCVPVRNATLEKKNANVQYQGRIRRIQYYYSSKIKLNSSPAMSLAYIWRTDS